MTDIISQLASLPASATKTIPALFAAVVARVDDPLGLKRIKVLIANRDGNAESDWFQCASPSASTNFDDPIPNQSIAICAYLDGEVNQGIWLGILFTQSQPPPFKSALDDIVVQPTGRIKLLADESLELNAARDILINSQVAEASIRMEALGGELILRLGLLEVSVRDLVDLP